MEELKIYIEKLNNLYYKLNGLYEGVVSNFDSNNNNCEEIDFFKGYLDPSYIGSFLEEVDDYVIQKLNHGLETDSYLFTETNLAFSKEKGECLYKKVLGFIVEFQNDLRTIEGVVVQSDIDIPGFSVCCQEMRSIADQIDESVYHIDRQLFNCEYEPVN